MNLKVIVANNTLESVKVKVDNIRTHDWTMKEVIEKQFNNVIIGSGKTVERFISHDVTFHLNLKFWQWGGLVTFKVGQKGFGNLIPLVKCSSFVM